MSRENDKGKAAPNPPPAHREDEDTFSSETQGFGILRTPGSGTGRPEETHTSISTTQTSSGLTAGDPGGGPHRTPERQAIDAARRQQPQPRSGRDPDLHDEPVRTPEDVNATPPHGDVPGKD